ncbi:uromodulin-like [Pseudophryne corroboree]|uniref:uromodulin-like n=1 Tax=Pseudophryne corroboree TaxID=495146 RepID=UPI003081DD12
MSSRLSLFLRLEKSSCFKLKLMVFILGAYPCGSTYDYDFQVYKDIASHSYGHVFQNVYSSTKVADFLNFFLQIPVNSTTQLLSIDQDIYYYATFNFLVSVDFTSLIVSTSCSSCSFTIYTPSGGQADGNNILSESWGSLSYVENPSIGLWTINVNAGGSFSLRVLGFKDNNNTSNGITSYICSRCDANASCRKNLLSHTCVCNEGFSGDGHVCYDINECDYYYYYYWLNVCSYGYCINTYGSYNCVCPSGFISENKTCVDVDECSRPGLNGCHVLATCYNYYGSYSCSCPAGYFGDGYNCELDECTRDVCGFARECIKTTGFHSCLDPCYSSTTLNEPSRSTSYHYYFFAYYYYGYYGRSDYFLNGWHRFEGSGGIRMPESCPSPNSCYTWSPIWLNETHPDQTDGIVNRIACVMSGGDCCYWTTNVQIKACPGNYHVYKFSGTPTYYAGYCTDPATVPEFCSCTDDEECKLVGGRYGCYCKHTDDISALQDLRPELTCGNQEIKATFLQCHLEKFKLNTKNVHLRDSSCTGFSDFNRTKIIAVLSVLKNGVCGNELVNNKTHIIYKNTIYLSMDSSLGGEDIVSIDYSCVYPLDIQLSLATALQPFSSSVDVSVEGTGQLLATIALYKDSSYKAPYEGTQVLLTPKTTLYIGILLKSADNAYYSVLMKNCYATPSKDSSTSAKYYLIRNSCPSKQDSTINVIENGNSQNGRFSVQLFQYVKDLNVVYLHCDIHICYKTNETCKPVSTSHIKQMYCYSVPTM